MSPESENRRILVIDDNEAIHEDFRKILVPSQGSQELDALEADLFGVPKEAAASTAFALTSATQGEQGYRLAQAARDAGNPFAVAFVDIRMPPGWDGIETSLKLWSTDPGLQVVLCTAYSDYSWEKTVERLGAGDRFLILKKPFDTVEVRQLALALSTKWSLSRQAGLRMEELEARVTERTQELTQVNQALRRAMSERERMELELVRAQKLESLGQLVAGIAHEINNPLGFMVSNLNYIGEELSTSQRTGLANRMGDITDALRETSGGAERIRTIVADLKSFCRTDETPPEPIEMLSVLDSTLNLAGPELALVCALHRELSPVPRVLANGIRLSQVFLNLVINAMQSMPAAKRATNALTVRSRLVGSEVQVEVIDTGSGIAPEALPRIFDPFFTTRPIGQGTGLGLSVCHGIVEAIGGRIEVESQVGRGTTMRVCLRAAA